MTIKSKIEIKIKVFKSYCIVDKRKMNLIHTYKEVELVASLIGNNIVATRSIDALPSKNACLTLKYIIEKQRQKQR